MRIAFFDPVAGASGDMAVGALINAGARLEDIERELATVAISGYRLTASTAHRGVVRGTEFGVLVDDDQPPRNWAQIRELVATSGMTELARSTALSIFTALAVAEADVHAVPIESVHFHEVGAVDSIVDICGFAIALDQLGVEQVFSGPMATGNGFVESSHGLLPVPAPATAALIAKTSAPLAGASPVMLATPGELLTPTGAAILTTLATFAKPTFTVWQTGYGFGRREYPWPNVLPVTIGEMAGSASSESDDSGELVVESNLDDMNPQHVELLLERLFADGALDAWITPLQMKKQRPAFSVSVIVPASALDRISDLLLRESPTFGVRSYPIDRVKAGRAIVQVVTKWGEVAVKLKILDGRVVDAAPEHDACLTIAREREVPIREVWFEARRIAESHIGRLATDLPQ